MLLARIINRLVDLGRRLKNMPLALIALPQILFNLFGCFAAVRYSA